MEYPKKVVISLILVFAIGAAAGYFYGAGKQKTESEEISRQSAETGEEMAAEKKDRVMQKINLLKNYIKLVYLPPDQVGNAEGLVNDMNEALGKISDQDLIEKYEATVDENKQEDNILSFFNSLIESIKADLQ